MLVRSLEPNSGLMSLSKLKAGLAGCACCSMSWKSCGTDAASMASSTSTSPSVTSSRRDWSKVRIPSRRHVLAIEPGERRDEEDRRVDHCELDAVHDARPQHG